MMYGDPPFSVLVGKTLTDARKVANDRIEFDADDGSQYALWHSQDCCESVDIDDISGDLADLVGSPILVAEERENEPIPENVKAERERAASADEYAYTPESETWTFYTLRTLKGTVDIRWHGTSNGYYSERVDFSETRPATPVAARNTDTGDK